MAVKPTVLIYNITDKKRKSKLQTFCVMNGIRIRAVKPEECGLTIGELLDSEKKEELPEVEETFSEEMMIMCYMRDKMDALLAYLRKEKTVIELKAVLTPTNSTWTSVELHRELNKEREMIRQRLLEKNKSQA